MVDLLVVMKAMVVWICVNNVAKQALKAEVQQTPLARCARAVSKTQTTGGAQLYGIPSSLVSRDCEFGERGVVSTT
jgi:hypothetical protein